MMLITERNYNAHDNDTYSSWRFQVNGNGAARFYVMQHPGILGENGNLPKEIGDLLQLRVIYLEDNLLSGNLPKEIGRLPQLREIYLGSNKLSGSIPLAFFNNSGLQEINLGYNRFSKGNIAGFIPKEIGLLNNLEVLYLGFNHLTESIPWNIFNISSLKLLYLAHNSLSGSLPSDLGCGLSHLEEMHLQFNTLIGNIPNSISNASKLTNINFGANNLSGAIPNSLGNLGELEKLGLYANDLNLDASSPELSFVAFLTNCRHLELLDISNIPFYTEFPKSIGNLSSLQYFQWNIAMKSNEMKFEIQYSSFWSLKDILDVSLYSNALTGILPKEIQDLKAIVELDLSRNEISGNIPTTIGSLQNLQYLYLAHNKLQGLIPVSLGKLISLNCLDFSQNNISGEIPKSLESLQDLKYINFSYNNLEGEIPNGGPFINFTAQSFMHNEALCGKSSLQVPPCPSKENRHSRRTKLILIKIIFPIILSATLVVSGIVLLFKGKSRANQLERDFSSLELQRRVSYYENQLMDLMRVMYLERVVLALCIKGYFLVE